MKIAVSYANGEVFQHFGKTEFFKIYETEGKRILSGQVVPTDGIGHEALAEFLKGLGVEVVICGGLGDGAMAALTGAGIEVCSGAEGDTDLAVDSYLKGQLVSTGTNCDHHHHEDASEGCGGCGGSCGSGCGGGCSGCRPTIEGKNVGKTCRVHYRGTFNDGTQFDASYDRGEPLEFVCGAGMMIPGFDAAVAQMDIGQVIDIHLMPEEAYGMPDPGAIFSLAIADLPGAEEAEVGQRVYLYNSMGQPVPVTVAAKDETNITFDANHEMEMAGKELNFQIQLLEVE